MPIAALRRWVIALVLSIGDRLTQCAPGDAGDPAIAGGAAPISARRSTRAAGRLGDVSTIAVRPAGVDAGEIAGLGSLHLSLYSLTLCQYQMQVTKLVPQVALAQRLGIGKLQVLRAGLRL